MHTETLSDIFRGNLAARSIYVMNQLQQIPTLPAFDTENAAAPTYEYGTRLARFVVGEIVDAFRQNDVHMELGAYWKALEDRSSGLRPHRDVVTYAIASTISDETYSRLLESPELLATVRHHVAAGIKREIEEQD